MLRSNKKYDAQKRCKIMMWQRASGLIILVTKFPDYLSRIKDFLFVLLLKSKTVGKILT